MKLAERDRNYWILFALLLLLGVISMLCVGQIAVRAMPNWSVNADIGSNIDPDQRYLSQKGTIVFEPILAGILTPPAWRDTFLTPEPGPLNIATVVVSILNPGGSSEINLTMVPSATPILPTNTPVNSPTPAPTNTYIFFPPTATRTPTNPGPTRTFTSTTTPTRTYTPTSTSTSTHTSTSTTTSTATSTSTTTFTATSTSTATLTHTNTTCPTDTPTFTVTPSTTFTPTYTPTPSLTLTPSHTSTATLTYTPITTDPFPYGAIGSSRDNSSYTLGDNGQLTFQLPVPIQVIGHGGYDIVYYELAAGSGINLDNVVIYISSDGATWLPIFNWGGGGADTASNVNISGPLGGSEDENRDISSGFLYNGTGVAINLDALVGPGTYPYIRIYAPPTANNDGCDIDGIELLY